MIDLGKCSCLELSEGDRKQWELAGCEKYFGIIVHALRSRLEPRVVLRRVYVIANEGPALILETYAVTNEDDTALELYTETFEAALAIATAGAVAN